MIQLQLPAAILASLQNKVSLLQPIKCNMGSNPSPDSSEKCSGGLLTVIFSVLCFWQCQFKISPVPLEAFRCTGFNTGSFYQATDLLWKALFCRWACGFAQWVICDVALVHYCKPAELLAELLTVVWKMASIRGLFTALSYRIKKWESHRHRCWNALLHGKHQWSTTEEYYYYFFGW